MKGDFFSELKRRNVYKVAIAYVVGGWALSQGIAQVFPVFDVPNWTVRLIIVLIVLGLPVALVLAWMFEITSEGVKRTEDVDPVTQSGKKSSAWIYVVILGVLISVGLFFAGRYTASDRTPGGSLEKSVAVLPFENLSEDKANAFFASGIQDEILTRLAKIGALKVISRTSTANLATRPVNLPEIARQLGVANILEGSVQKVGERVHVNVQLIRADTDEHLWAESYDRKLDDIFAVEGEVAQKIASALKATLSGAEQEALVTKPTLNSQAYQLYLKARQFELKPDTLQQDYRTAEQLYLQAVTLDPNFALAHARLAMTRARIYHFFEPTQAWSAGARKAAATAVQLQPALGEAHQALGLCSYWFERDYPAALREFEIARTLVPGDTSIPWDMAAIKRRQGNWSEAIADYREILAIDPENANVVRDLLYVYCALRDWPNAEATAQRLLTLTPDSLNAKAQIGYIELWTKGSTARLKSEMATIPPGKDPDGTVSSYRIEVSMIDRDPAGAERVLAACPLEALSYYNDVDTPRSFFAGEIALLRGDMEAARTELARARDFFAASVQEAPAIPERHAYLGLTCAFLGEKERAIREGTQATELRPESQDALDGPNLEGVLALIYARTNETARAVALLQHLLSIPGAVDTVNHSITIQDLRLRWEWDPIRNDPGFQQLLAGTSKDKAATTK